MRNIFFIFCFLISVDSYGQEDIGYFTDLASTKGVEDSVIVLDLVSVGITDELYKFKNLEKLFIVSSEIDSVLASILELKKLQVIKIENSKLKFIHPKVFDLPHLKSLVIKGNEIKQIDFKENLTIEYLDISYNNLNGVEGVQKLSNLKKLLCRGNNLEILPCEILSLKNLKHIDFSENNIYKSAMKKN